MTKVYKFGGASVKDADSIRNMSGILHLHSFEKLIVVVSAMGKTTNLLELNLMAARNNNENFEVLFQQLIDFHQKICNELFTDCNHPVFKLLENTFGDLKEQFVDKNKYSSFDEHYDACISFGELLSTYILDAFLAVDNHIFRLIDARDYIITDDNFRQANVDWKITESNIKTLEKELLPATNILTQGFIARSKNQKTTTLGREGSDYTAAIFASCLNSDEVVIWKDVPGLLNADPKRFTETIKLDVISYAEAIELAYYGATIIHPNTIKPLQNKKIPLKVKSFLHPELNASVICDEHKSDSLIPSFIVKDNQVLISISPRDFSFMNETNLYRIFKVISNIGLTINVLQTSAISLSVCTDFHQEKIDLLKDKLICDFTIRYNEGLSLLTIRHYKHAQIPEFFSSREVLLEQRSRATLQLVLK
jgi:aspartate kinase